MGWVLNLFTTWFAGLQAILVYHSCVSHVGRALGNYRLVGALPTSHASFLWVVVCLFICVQRHFCLHPMALRPTTKQQNTHANAPPSFSVLNCE